MARPWRAKRTVKFGAVAGSTLFFIVAPGTVAGLIPWVITDWRVDEAVPGWAAGIGWVILNREAEYIPELRRLGTAPSFAVSSNHLEIGRIQGLQMAALLPKGGNVIYIQGPSDNPAAKQRTRRTRFCWRW